MPRTFPREYLLRVYAAAVEHGCIELSPIDEPTATSFRQTFYRLRRRSDKGNAHLILPEYHLVTVGDWRQTPRGGALTIYYNAIPEGEDPLPSILPIDPHEAPPMPPPSPSTFVPPISQEEQTDLDAYMKELIEGSRKHDD